MISLTENLTLSRHTVHNLEEGERIELSHAEARPRVSNPAQLPLCHPSSNFGRGTRI